MSDGSSDPESGVQLDSSDEESTEVLSEESGDLATAVGTVVPASTNGAAPALPEPVEESEADQAEQSSWVPLAVGVLLVALIAGTAILLLLQSRSNNPDPSQAGRGVGSQAAWQITSFAVGGKDPGAKNPAPPKEQTAAVERLVRDFHDALFLFPAELKQTTNKFFTAPAADALAKSDIGLPASAKDIRTTRRFARIGIEADGAQRAAAFVEIVATGTSKEGPFKIASTSRMWLERDGAQWNVIAFDLDQRPLRAQPKDRPKDQPKDKPDAKPESKDKKPPAEKPAKPRRKGGKQ
jgi:hypothetical protein